MRPHIVPNGREVPSERPARLDHPLLDFRAHRSLSIAARRTPAHDAPSSGGPRPFLEYGNDRRPPVIGYVALAPGDIDVFAPARGIGAWCETNGWPLTKVVHDMSAGAHPRRGLTQTLQDVHAGRAAGLVLARLHDLGDTAVELLPVLRWFADGNAFVIALDYELRPPEAGATQRSGGLNSGTMIPRGPADGRR
jgi:hypothetical protein